MSLQGRNGVDTTLSLCWACFDYCLQSGMFSPGKTASSIMLISGPKRTGLLWLYANSADLVTTSWTSKQFDQIPSLLVVRRNILQCLLTLKASGKYPGQTVRINRLVWNFPVCFCSEDHFSCGPAYLWNNITLSEFIIVQLDRCNYFGNLSVIRWLNYLIKLARLKMYRIYSKDLDIQI